MRVIWEPCAARDGEVVEHQERGEVAKARCADGTANFGAGAFGDFVCDKGCSDFAGGGGSGGEGGILMRDDG